MRLPWILVVMVMLSLELLFSLLPSSPCINANLTSFPIPELAVTSTLSSNLIIISLHLLSASIVALGVLIIRSSDARDLIHQLYSAPDERSIYVDADTRIQILETMLMLPQADREQCAAFIVSALSSHFRVAYFTIF